MGVSGFLSVVLLAVFGCAVGHGQYHKGLVGETVLGDHSVSTHRRGLGGGNKNTNTHNRAQHETEDSGKNHAGPRKRVPIASLASVAGSTGTVSGDAQLAGAHLSELAGRQSLPPRQSWSKQFAANQVSRENRELIRARGVLSPLPAEKTAEGKKIRTPVLLEVGAESTTVTHVHAKHGPSNTALLDLGERQSSTAFEELMEQAQEAEKAAAAHAAQALNTASADEDTEDEVDSNALESLPASQYEGALDTLRDKITRKSRDVIEEKAWLQDVNSIIAEYGQKMMNVQGDITTKQSELKTYMKNALKVENLRLQSELMLRLKAAKENLKTLKMAADSAKKKQGSFANGKLKVQTEIDKIESSLKKLQTGGGKKKGSSVESGDKSNKKSDKSDK